MVILEPWVAKKIENALYEANSNYEVKIGNVDISMFSKAIELKRLTIFSNHKPESDHDLNGEIESIKIKGINLTKAIFKKHFDIRSITISNGKIHGKIPFTSEHKQARVSSANISIGKIRFDKVDFALKNTLSAQSYKITEGDLCVYNLQLNKEDTLSSDMIGGFDFNAKEFIFVSSDSMYTSKSIDIVYSATTQTMAIDSSFILPNYEGYDFTSRHQFETDRVEAEFHHIVIHHFHIRDFIRSKSLLSSYVEVGRMDMNVFRDKRKQFKHLSRPTVQDLLRNHPGIVSIDSARLIDGNLTYKEHAEKANYPGTISFNNLHMKIQGITNDTCDKAENKPVEILFESLLMGKGKLSFSSKMEIFDPRNPFTLSGSLSQMDLRELNPILEKNTFVLVTSGKIERMHFRFRADNDKAVGEMTMLYEDFKVAIKNKRTDETTAVKEQLISTIANMKILDSNPLPGKEVRIGTIDNARDPEKFLFNYCLQSMLSGFASTLVDRPARKRNE